MMYQCTPSQLEKETGYNLVEMMRDLLCAAVEREVHEKRLALRK